MGERHASAATAASEATECDAAALTSRSSTARCNQTAKRRPPRSQSRFRTGRPCRDADPRLEGNVDLPKAPRLMICWYDSTIEPVHVVPAS